MGKPYEQGALDSSSAHTSAVRGRYLGMCLGRRVPVRNDAKAEIILHRTDVSDGTFLQAMERKGLHKVLDQGTTLLVCLTMRSRSKAPEPLRTLLKPYDYFKGAIAPVCHDYWNPGSTIFVEVTLGAPKDKQASLFESNRGGRWLMTEGAEAVGLPSTTVLLPAAISTKPIASLNHAYTKLSEVFETWRISHTGNIYARVLYRERNGIWYPLDILRNDALVTQEQNLARELWDDFLGKMSSRHV
jgi:hypothetical protein